MKRIICLITVLCIIFSSFSFCFGADWTDSDKQNLQNIASRLYYNNYSAAYYLYQILSHMSTIEGYIDQLEGFLQYGGHNISYWVNSISTWMSPIYNELTDIVGVSDLEGLILANSNQSITNTQGLIRSTMHEQLGDSTSPGYQYGWYSVKDPRAFGGAGESSFNWGYGTPIGNLALLLARLNNSQVEIYQHNFSAGLLSFGDLQTATNWGNLGSSTFTPSSATDGIYKWLSAIQTPVARLSYVLASNADVDARESAAANQQAVVDNFIDSTGDGSASPSDIGSISDLSSGYKNNFGSDAQVTGIFNIFNSNNMGWFSQETANQLDTSANTRRGSSFYTPLLDKQIEDIYDQIGVKHD